MRTKTLSPLRPALFYPPRGEKKIYLPNFTLTLLRTPHAPAHFASFLTPLHLNKLDLKDYLWHAYGLQALGVRSFVIHARVREDMRGRDRPVLRRWYRPRATKKMTVELVQDAPGQGAFQWPEPPTDLTPWSKKAYDLRLSERKEDQKRDEVNAEIFERPTKHTSAVGKQARALRRGDEVWRPGWMDWGVVGGRRRVDGGA